MRPTQNRFAIALLALIAAMPGCLRQYTIDLDGGRDVPSIDVVSEAVDAIDAYDAFDATDAFDAVVDDGVADTRDVNMMCGDANLGTDPRNCGTCGHDCTVLPHVINLPMVACMNGQCVVPTMACAQGYSHCTSNPDDGCETAITTALHCGTCAMACSGATPLCFLAPTTDGGLISGTCRSSCSGLDMCSVPGGAACVNFQNDPNNCNSCGHGCFTPPNSRALCTSGSCSTTCLPGFHSCSGSCVENIRTDTCGALCTPCMLPAHGDHTTCDGTTCGYVCSRGYFLESPGCQPLPPPRPVSPMSTSWVNTTRPVLRVANTGPMPTPSGTHFDVCSDRACTRVEVANLDVAGNTATVPIDLSVGAHFWRAHYNYGTDRSVDTATWEFFVQHLASPRTLPTAPASAEGSTLDYNGDGFADLVEVTPNLSPGITIFTGGPGAVMMARSAGANLAQTNEASMVTGAGDVNGDGFGDFAVADPFNNVQVFYGLAGMATPTSTMVQGPGHLASSQIAGVGDVNGDGYGDILIGGIAQATLYLGGPQGIDMSTPMQTINPPAPSDAAVNPFGFRVSSAGDTNADGFADFAVGDGVGNVFVFLGAAAQPYASIPLTAGGTFGRWISNAHDVNGDGYSDLLVDSVLSTNAHTYLFLGSAIGTIRNPMSNIVTTVGSNEAARQVSGVGDSNGDGFADVVIPQGGISLFVYAGAPGGLTPAPVQTATLMDAQQYDLSGGGDLDGDGFADTAIGYGHAGRITVELGGLSSWQPGPVLVGPSHATFGFGFTIAVGGR